MKYVFSLLLLFLGLSPAFSQRTQKVNNQVVYNTTGATGTLVIPSDTLVRAQDSAYVHLGSKDGITYIFDTTIYGKTWAELSGRPNDSGYDSIIFINDSLVILTGVYGPDSSYVRLLPTKNPLRHMRVDFLRVRAANASSPLVTPTYDGSGQTTHPSIRYFPDGWNGYKYWMAHTPYADGNDDLENPSMLVSQDGQTWIDPPGLTNPIEAPPVNLSQYWADTEIELGPNDSMYLFFIDQTTNVYVRASADGITWTTKTKVISNTVQTILSPGVYYDKPSATWVMYYINMAGSPNVIQRRTASTPYGPWSAPTTCSFTGVPSGRDLWHMSILKTNDQWHAFVTISDLDTYTNGALHFAVSNDGLNFNMTTTPVLDKSPSGWDNRNIYRTSALLIDKGDAQVYGLWYSASSTASTWGNWRLGYTEMTLGGQWYERNNSVIPFVDTLSVNNIKATGVSNLKDIKIFSGASVQAQPLLPFLEIPVDRSSGPNRIQLVDNYGGYVGEREQSSLLGVFSFGLAERLTKHPIANFRWAPSFTTPGTINLTWARVIGDKTINLTPGSWTFAQNTANRPHASFRGVQSFIQSSAGIVNVSIGNSLSGGYSYIATTHLEASSTNTNQIKITGTLGNYASDFYLAGGGVDTLETATHFLAATPRKENPNSWIKNAYGVRIEPQTGAGNPYAIYQEGATDSVIFKGIVKFDGSVIGLSGGGGVTDHGALTGLGDDDHSQYLLLSGRSGQTINDRLDIGNGTEASGSPTVFINVDNTKTGPALAIGQEGNANYFQITKDGNIPKMGGYDVGMVGTSTGIYFPNGISFLQTASAQNGGAILKGLSSSIPWAFDNSAITSDGVTGLAIRGSNATNPGPLLELMRHDNTARFSITDAGIAKFNGYSVPASQKYLTYLDENENLQTSTINPDSLSRIIRGPQFMTDTITTTDATPTNISVQPPSGIGSISEFGVVEVTMTGVKKNTLDGLTGKKIVRYKYDGTTLTLGTITDVLSTQTDGTMSGASWTITQTSNNIVIQVTGLASSEIKWVSTFLVTKTVLPN